MSDDQKCGYTRDDWIARCSDILKRFGYQPHPAECAAVAAWDEADQWMTPDEAAHEVFVGDAT